MINIKLNLRVHPQFVIKEWFGWIVVTVIKEFLRPKASTALEPFDFELNCITT